MKLKKTRLERTCSNCKETIDKGDLYGQKTKSDIFWQTSWTVDNRPKEEIPDWAWSKVYFPTKTDWCAPCGAKEAA